MKKRSWLNAPGHYYGEIERSTGITQDDEAWFCDTRKLPEEVQSRINELAGLHVFAEVEIEFTSTGYYDPGVTTAAPEDCYPPEGEDERTVQTMVLKFGDDEHDVKAWLADAFAKEIQDADIDVSDDE